MKQLTFAVALCLWAGQSFAQQMVTVADIVDKYFIAANGFETRIVHPRWKGDRLFVEDVRFIGHYPDLLGVLPTGTSIVGVDHPADMMNGTLVYRANPLFGGPTPQVVVFYRTDGHATRGIHAIMVFEGPPEGSPSMFKAMTRTVAEWIAGREGRDQSLPP